MDEEVVDSIKDLVKEVRRRPIIREAWRSYDEFIEKFPFKDRPESIDKLTPR